MNVKNEFGQTLLALRKDAGKSQAEIAQMLEITTAAYQNYENGRREAGYATIVKLADFYNVSTDYLLGRTTVKAMAKPAEGELTEEEITEIEKDIVSSYTALPVETRRACIQALTTVLGDVFDIEEQTENEPLTEDPEELAQ